MPTPGGSGLVPNSPLLTEEKVDALGNSSTRNVGTTVGTVAAGDDARFSNSGGAGTSRTLYAPTRWYLVGAPARVTNSTPTEGREDASRFVAARSTTLTSVAIKVTTAGTTGALVRIGVRAEASNGLPGAVLAEGTVDPTTTGVKTLTVSVPVTAGSTYFVTTTVQGAATTRPALEHLNGDGGNPDLGEDTVANAFTNWTVGYSTNNSSTTGSLSASPGWGGIGSVPRKMISAAT